MAELKGFVGYHAFHKTVWLQKRKVVEVKLGGLASQNHFFTAAGKPAALLPVATLLGEAA
jgi:hypothetical protein